MTVVQIGLIGLVVMVVLFAFSVPVGIAMAVVGAIGYAIIVNPSAAISLLVTDFYTQFCSYSFTTMPMFILMGMLCFYSNISKKLYDTTYTLLGHIRGGLAIATVCACACFAAISGSSNASAAAMGKVTLPEMKRYHYDDSLSTASVAAAGCLGILIPPSGVMIIYGIQTETNISALFAAGIVPGLVLTAFMCIAVFLVCQRHPDYGPIGEKTTFTQKIKSLGGVVDMLILFVLVILGMFLGWFTPTQGGAIGAAGAFVLGKLRGTLSWRNTWLALLETAAMSCMVMAIVGGAAVFGHFMAISTIPAKLSAYVGGLNLPPAVIMIFIVLIYFLGGCFMDSLALILLTLPVIYPVIISLGFDPIWFGVIIVVVAEMGLVTPPVGLNVYIIGNMSKVPLMTIFRGVVPYFICMLLLAGLLIACPGLCTWLPHLLGY